MKREQPPTQTPLLRMVLFGPPGVGKTTLLRTFDLDKRSGRCLIVNCAGNPVSILRLKPEPVVITVTTVEDLTSIYNFFAQGQRPDDLLRKELNLPADVRFNTLGIDTLTEWQQIVIASNSKGSRNAFAGKWEMRIQDWKAVLQQTVSSVNLLFNLPVHVILVHQEKNDYDDQGRVFKTHPFLQGDSVNMVPMYAELVARMERFVDAIPGQPPRIRTKLTFEGGATSAAKNQVHPLLGFSMDNPTASKMLDIIEQPTPAPAPEVQDPRQQSLNLNLTNLKGK